MDGGQRLPRRVLPPRLPPLPRRPRTKAIDKVRTSLSDTKPDLDKITSHLALILTEFGLFAPQARRGRRRPGLDVPRGVRAPLGGLRVAPGQR